MNNKGRGQKNREIGLVQKNDVAQIYAVIELERVKKQQQENAFESLKKTLFVAQNQDLEWQAERKEIAALVAQIQEKRKLLGLLMHINPSMDEKLSLNTFLINQQQKLSLLEKETNQRYALDIHIPPISFSF